MSSPPVYQQFAPLPSDETIRITWPTPNRSLFTTPNRYFARTRANPDYGKPGFTRDCGRRFHRGCDIAPITVTATGQSTLVIFSDCATGTDYESDEPTFVPHDDVFCVFAGRVVKVVTDETASDFGRHVVIEHHWPRCGEKFFTLYGHLAEIRVTNHQSLITGHLLGRMGQSSRSADARNWMPVAPHLHFEVRNAAGQPHNPEEFLRVFLGHSTVDGR